jgi:hypothetical protein
MNQKWQQAMVRRRQARRLRLGLSPDPLTRLSFMHNSLRRMQQQALPCGRPAPSPLSRVKALLTLC